LRVFDGIDATRQTLTITVGQAAARIRAASL